MVPLAAGGPELSAVVEEEVERTRELSQRDSVHTTALAVDPSRWELVRFVLWQGGVPDGEPATERYEVLHLSAPGLGGLPDGRHW
ncbi:DUF4865 family protein [Actinoplanes utahensis]|uniref:DUF4865 family protein n=1 Tax=Actinoplanes utahensis TaxID=1869 RepID=UPI002E24A8BC